MREYRRMTWTDRLKLEALYNAGLSFRSIARELCFSPSAIHYEVQHGLYTHLVGKTWCEVKRYSATIAQEYVDLQVTSKGVPIKLGHRYDYAQAAAEAIRSGISPDVFTGDRRKKGLWTVSTPTLYRYIDKGYIPGVTSQDLHVKPRRKRHRRMVQAKRPPKGTSIEQRPDIVSTRSTFGHWELDSVVGKAVGKGQSLLTLTERMTRYELILRVPDKKAATTVRALDGLFRRFPVGTFQSITVDNGCEFQDCYGMEHDKDGNRRTTIYYCHPYTSCERGSNERANGIIRRWLPKGQSLAQITQKDCDRIADMMNTMPRKILGYASSAELFHFELEKILKDCSNGLDN